jgi:hypothetical protein
MSMEGKPFELNKVKLEDLEVGVLKTTWIPEIRHPSVTQDQIAAVSKIIIIGMLVSISKGAWTVSDEWNRLLPDYKFTEVEEFLSDVWVGKP